MAYESTEVAVSKSQAYSNGPHGQRECAEGWETWRMIVQIAIRNAIAEATLTT